MKTFLSIGTGPGIGMGTAERFATEGFRLVLSARDEQKTEALAEGLRAKGHDVHRRSVDASDANGVAALVASVHDEFGGIDVIHYNAANIRRATLGDQPLESFMSDLAVNIAGAMAATREAARNMKPKKSGTILLTGGGFALSPHPEYISISVGKAGIRALAQGLFDEYKQHGVHIATVTVAGFVSPDTPQISAIADQFWQLHSQPIDAWSVEAIYQP
ncbi:SDR family NAD(P)-dependent oxidoreductase [Sinorhizobium americanum]|nr:SDR family NAD(P)-dependent oxidoreductase [Sinorhizobium americanum]OAP39484.1 short-chain dehydrogenase [Sinorhizobium americanum]